MSPHDQNSGTQDSVKNFHPALSVTYLKLFTINHIIRGGGGLNVSCPTPGILKCSLMY